VSLHAEIGFAGRLHGPSIADGDFEMQVSISPFLRNVLIIDALFSSGGAIIMMAGATALAPLLELPASLLFWSGAALVPFVAMLIMAIRGRTASALMLIAIVMINALWALGSFSLLIGDAVSPNLFGIAFVGSQGVAVALLAELEFVGLRRAEAAAG
jgi:hypothetical protein